MWELFYDRFLTPLDDPGSRLFHLNLLGSILLAIVFLYFQGRRVGGSLSFEKVRKIFLNPRYWWNRSTRLDYQIYALNSALKVLLFIPFLDFGFRFSQWTVKGLIHWHGDFAGLEATWPWLMAMTVFSFVFDDFLRFFHHWLMHHISWLWPFHETHHSARVLTPATLFRTHPVEAAMAAIRNSLSLGISTGVFLFLFESRFTLVTFLGVNLFGQLFNFLGSNLRHSHIPLSFGFFEWIFISPRQHQLHHSRDARDYDRNFGVSLSVWDAMFGTLVRSKEIGNRVLSFGLNQSFEGRLTNLIWSPFGRVLTTLSKRSQILAKSAPQLCDRGIVAKTSRNQKLLTETTHS